MNLFRRANNTASDADFTYFGDKRVEIPKLTIEKWKLLFTKIEILPSLVVSVITAKQTSDLTAYILAALDTGLDEVVDLVGIISGLDPEWIKKNVGLSELIDFIEKTIRKNDFAEAGKKFHAVFGNLLTAGAAKSRSVSTSGSSNAPSGSE